LQRLIAVPSDGKTVDSQISDRFARASFFLVFDEEGLLREVIENKAKEAGHGAGGQAVQELSRSGVFVVLAPRIGPKAQAALNAAGMEFYEVKNCNTCKQAVEEYINEGPYKER